MVFDRARSGCGFFMTSTTRQSIHHPPIRGVYLITDDSPAQSLLAKVHQALLGGARIVQYRDKNRPRSEQKDLALELKALCHSAGALFIINDSAELAAEVNADGVHLGQSDGRIDAARALLGPDALIGVSTQSVELARQAADQGADYIGVGSVYPTGTKHDAVPIGLDALQTIAASVTLPVVAIGGIDSTRLAEVIQAGADSVAVVSAIMSDPQPAIACRELALQFNRHTPLPHGRVLTVAGSDSGGGAGIQADIKAITLLGSYASSVLTALTAQNTLGVSAIHAPPVEFVRQQLNAVLDDIGTDVIKTGMLYNAEIISAVAEIFRHHAALCVIDPVMIAKGGSALLQPAAIEAFTRELLPQAYLLTPNVPEAEALSGQSINNIEDMITAAEKLRGMGARHVFLKGGHLAGDPVDILLSQQGVQTFPQPRLDTPNTHGTGCTTASVIATLLAQGYPLNVAVKRAKQFITAAIANAMPLGAGHGPVNHYTAALTLAGTEVPASLCEDISS
jgi:hydroxymethylpyrimidine kinase/phosphomethylpyrimidine kinase/thiamine-phosphate diphosphorylase